MPSAADRLKFGPRRDPGALRAFGLAVLVHLLLIVALTWGVNWKHSDPNLFFVAELWSSVPQEAAPKPLETPPPPPPPPAPEPPQARTPPPAPTPDVDIALEQEKKRKLLLQKKEAELQKAKAAKEKLQTELQDKKEKEQKAKEELAKRKAEEAKKLEAKKAEDKKQDAKELEEQKLAEAAVQKQRQDAAIKRMMGLAGATGGADAKGAAQNASGPSASYGGKVRAKVKPNIVFTEDIAGNPTAEVEVHTALDGSIIRQRLIKPSGNKAWDEAVIKAIIRTETMPRDVDGRVPTPMILEFRPRD